MPAQMFVLRQNNCKSVTRSCLLHRAVTRIHRTVTLTTTTDKSHGRPGKKDGTGPCSRLAHEDQIPTQTVGLGESAPRQ